MAASLAGSSGWRKSEALSPTRKAWLIYSRTLLESTGDLATCDRLALALTPWKIGNARIAATNGRQLLRTGQSVALAASLAGSSGRRKSRAQSRTRKVWLIYSRALLESTGALATCDRLAQVLTPWKIGNARIAAMSGRQLLRTGQSVALAASLAGSSGRRKSRAQSRTRKVWLIYSRALLESTGGLATCDRLVLALIPWKTGSARIAAMSGRQLYGTGQSVALVAPIAPSMAMIDRELVLSI